MHKFRDSVFIQVQEQTEKELFNERLTVKARLDAERREFGDLYAAEVNAVGGDELPRVTVELDRSIFFL